MRNPRMWNPGARKTRALALLVSMTVTGCDGGAPRVDAGTDASAVEPDAGPPPPDVSGLPVIAAANAIGAEDPRFEGQQRFLYDAFGTERVSGFPPTAFFERLMREEPAIFGDGFASFGFVSDPNDDFPVGFKPGLEDPTRVQVTCAMCHVARLPDDRLWFGAPNVDLDFAGFLLAVNERWTAEGNEPFLDDVARSKLPELGPGRTGAESDSYAQVVPADFPTYFRLGQRTSLNYLGTGQDARTEIYLSVYSAGAGNPNPRDAIVPWPSDARLDPMIAFMSQLEPPSAPPQDAAAIAMGRAIYEREGCDGCHHVDDPAALGVVTYDTAMDGRERLPGEDPDFPRGSIRTSRLHRVLIEGDDGGGGGPDEGLADLFQFITRNGLSTRLSDGYRAADLRMLWYTAPYLHNGSVPTLEDLLRPAAERPTTFMRGDFLVDTTAPGNDNAGHEFGTAITEEERTALAAYLRSL